MIRVPNATNAQLMATPRIRPFRRSPEEIPVTPIELGLFVLGVEKQAVRYGKTKKVGSISPSTVGPWELRELSSRSNNDRITFKLNRYDGLFEGNLILSWGSNLAFSTLLAYDEDGAWVGVSTTFTNFLISNLGQDVTVELRLQ